MDREEQLAIGLGWARNRGHGLSHWPMWGSRKSEADSARSETGWLREVQRFVSAILLAVILFLVVLLVVIAIGGVTGQFNPFGAGRNTGPVVVAPQVEETPHLRESAAPEVLPTAVLTVQTTSEAGYKFLYLTDDGVPILYPACNPITFSLDPSGVPEGGELAVRDAIDRADLLTGLDLTYVGLSNELSSNATVTVRWMRWEDDPSLSNESIGNGGSSYRIMSDGREAKLLGGRIKLRTDRDGLAMPNEDPTMWQAVTLHEIGHVLGLDHSNDPESLMAPVGAYELTEQDKLGFAAVGQGRCWDQD